MLRELRNQGWAKPVLGESTLTSQKVIDLAGDAAIGAIAHVGLAVDALVPAIRSFRDLYLQAYQVQPDHNSMKGFAAVHVMKVALERAGRIDRRQLAQTMRGLKVNAQRVPGALMYTEYDGKGDLDRMSFLVEVRQRRPEVIDYLPPLSMKSVQRAPQPAGLPSRPLTPPQARPGAAASST